MLQNGEPETTKEMFIFNHLTSNRDVLLLEIVWQIKRIADQIEQRFGR
jgi:hypothetical protein